jgi:hypothetical protein
MSHKALLPYVYQNDERALRGKAVVVNFIAVSDAAALSFVNQYWPVFYKELLPFAAEGWDEFWRGTLNKLFLQVPFNTIFPAN